MSTSYLTDRRAEIGDEAFIQRCLDGTFRGTVLDTALDVIAREHSGVPEEPTAADIAAAIVAEFDEPEPDRPRYGVFHVVRTVRDGRPLHHQPIAARIDATLTDLDSAVHLATALRLTRYRDDTTGHERILSAQQVQGCAEDNRALYLWLRHATRLATVSDATVVADADLHRCVPSPRCATSALSRSPVHRVIDGMGATMEDNCTVGIDDERFPAYDNGMRWNGFVCPRFRHSIAKQVTAYFNDINAAGPGPEDQDYFVWVGDTIVHIHGAYLHDPDYTPLLVEPDAQGRYAIGAMAWTWRRTD